MLQLRIQIFTGVGEFEFEAKPTVYGKEVFDRIVRVIGLRETWYFGLHYTDVDGFPAWLTMNEKVLNQKVDKRHPIALRLRVKLFPEKVEDEIIQDITLKLLYVQTRDGILSGAIYCPPETAVLLASYAMQIKYGDYAAENHRPGCLTSDRLLPQEVTANSGLSIGDWEKRIVKWWPDHKTLTKEDAMLEYLKTAQHLEMYGVHYFDVRNEKGTELYLGIDALGMSIYPAEDRTSVISGFLWNDIRTISYKDKLLIIKPDCNKENDVVLSVTRLRMNKRILDLCCASHDLYVQRRKPDTIEMQQMKQQANELKMQRINDIQRLLKEKNARIAAEQRQKECEEEIQRMKELVFKAQLQISQNRGNFERF